MTEPDDHERAVELLKELGMKTYEAECFAALSRIPSGTARDISEVANVPRTRVYDATESLAEKGFVEVQHTNPQQFRAISLSEAIGTLRDQYEDRVEELHDTLSAMETEDRSLGENEVWALTSDECLDGRLCEILAVANDDAFFVLGEEDCWSDQLAEALADAVDRGVDVHYAGPEFLTDVLQPREIDDVTICPNVEWLDVDADELGISKLLLVDRRTVFVSCHTDTEASVRERAIVAEGRTNPYVVLACQILDEAVSRPTVQQ